MASVREISMTMRCGSQLGETSQPCASLNSRALLLTYTLIFASIPLYLLVFRSCHESDLYCRVCYDLSVRHSSLTRLNFPSHFVV
jgi:hypothetical protein